jgi:hypothetical protein
MLAKKVLKNRTFFDFLSGASTLRRRKVERGDEENGGKTEN